MVYREQNRLADCLASFGALHVNDQEKFHVCPIVGEEAYYDDLAHVTWARRVEESV